jgi:hypothetical protein
MERRKYLIPAIDSICAVYRKEDEAMENQDRATKLELVMHYIIWKCPDPTLLGATKLNKILWYADLHAYLELGKPITGVSYIKRQYGPVPNQNDFSFAKSNLEKDKKIAITQDLYHGYPQYQFVALKKPNISQFSPDEISILDLTIEEVCYKYTASSISERTHGTIWDAAEIGEEIPIYAAYAARFGEITEEDIQWARAEAKRLNIG